MDTDNYSVSNGTIYVITNLVNGKQYVGQTNGNYMKRFQEHLKSLTRKDRYNAPLYCAIRKYGADNFKCDLLEIVPFDKLDEREQYWIEKLGTYRSGYNATAGGQYNKSYYTEQEREYILKTWLDCNKNATQASIKLGGIARAVIRKIAQSYGYVTDERPRFDHKVLAQKVQELGSVRKVSELFNCDRTVVYDACHEYGIVLKGKNKSVVQLDKNDNFLECFDSIADAVRFLKQQGINNARSGDISACCKGKQQTAYGYKWRYS